MKNQIISLAMIAGLAACSGGNPFDVVETEEVAGGETDGDGITTDSGVPPGTVSPSAGSTVFRSEPLSDAAGAENYGNGFANSVSYNSADDTFTVNNLAFDGDSPYQRGTIVSSLNEGRFAVYEAEDSATDPIGGGAIDQLTYRAVYGVSRNRTDTGIPTTQFAIIRTGNYIPYGFGGFIYQRDETVTLPASLQAGYTGSAGGLRDFKSGGGLQYTTSDIRISVDYDDFDDGAAVRGAIENRKVFDIDGNDITSEVANQISEGLTELPIARFVIGPGVLQESGDLVGEITANYTDVEGNVASYETGNYYAIMSGDNAEEIIGVFVLESASQSSRDTSGFIAYRGDVLRP
ncbi:hypothetical protein [uncultured Sulfitobacter sp.]|uniref:hypothetical protein n=1 Tax=uncultured Sulfitobacter sp. TaxID=191468 RepID=UPI0026159F38|nr:hypothetical protein [uncultured Sulfitobacter sp.]